MRAAVLSSSEFTKSRAGARPFGSSTYSIVNSPFTRFRLSHYCDKRVNAATRRGKIADRLYPRLKRIRHAVVIRRLLCFTERLVQGTPDVGDGRRVCLLRQLFSNVADPFGEVENLVLEVVRLIHGGAARMCGAIVHEM